MGDPTKQGILITLNVRRDSSCKGIVSLETDFLWNQVFENGILNQFFGYDVVKITQINCPKALIEGLRISK